MMNGSLQIQSVTTNQLGLIQHISVSRSAAADTAIRSSFICRSRVLEFGLLPPDIGSTRPGKASAIGATFVQLLMVGFLESRLGHIEVEWSGRLQGEPAKTATVVNVDAWTTNYLIGKGRS
jgi:hypothetical protein